MTLENLPFKKEKLTIKNQMSIIHKNLKRCTPSIKFGKVILNRVVLDQSLDKLCLGDRTAVFEASNKLATFIVVISVRLIVKISTVVAEVFLRKLSHVELHSL